jgi:hypothetical protein
VRDVAAVHSSLWPEDHNERGILNVALLTGQVNVWDAKTGVIETGPDARKRVDLATGAIITEPATPGWNKLPKPVPPSLRSQSAVNVQSICIQLAQSLRNHRSIEGIFT